MLTHRITIYRLSFLIILLTLLCGVANAITTQRFYLGKDFSSHSALRMLTATQVAADLNMPVTTLNSDFCVRWYMVEKANPTKRLQIDLWNGSPKWAGCFMFDYTLDPFKISSDNTIEYFTSKTRNTGMEFKGDNNSDVNVLQPKVLKLYFGGESASHFMLICDVSKSSDTDPVNGDFDIRYQFYFEDAKDPFINLGDHVAQSFTKDLNTRRGPEEWTLSELIGDMTGITYARIMLGDNTGDELLYDKNILSADGFTVHTNKTIGAYKTDPSPDDVVSLHRATGKHLEDNSIIIYTSTNGTGTVASDGNITREPEINGKIVVNFRPKFSDDSWVLYPLNGRASVNMKERKIYSRLTVEYNNEIVSALSGQPRYVRAWVEYDADGTNNFQPLTDYTGWGVPYNNWMQAPDAKDGFYTTNDAWLNWLIDDQGFTFPSSLQVDAETLTRYRVVYVFASSRNDAIYQNNNMVQEPTLGARIIMSLNVADIFPNTGNITNYHNGRIELTDTKDTEREFAMSELLHFVPDMEPTDVGYARIYMLGADGKALERYDGNITADGWKAVEPEYFSYHGFYKFRPDADETIKIKSRPGEALTDCRLIVMLSRREDNRNTNPLETEPQIETQLTVSFPVGFRSKFNGETREIIIDAPEVLTEEDTPWRVNYDPSTQQISLTKQDQLQIVSESVDLFPTESDLQPGKNFYIRWYISGPDGLEMESYGKDLNVRSDAGVRFYRTGTDNEFFYWTNQLDQSLNGKSPAPLFSLLLPRGLDLTTHRLVMVTSDLPIEDRNLGPDYIVHGPQFLNKQVKIGINVRGFNAANLDKIEPVRKTAVVTETGRALTDLFNTATTDLEADGIDVSKIGYVRMWVETGQGADDNAWTPITSYGGEISIADYTFFRARSEEYGYVRFSEDPSVKPVWNATLTEASFNLDNPKDYHKYRVVVVVSDKTDYWEQDGTIYCEPTAAKKFIYTLTEQPTDPFVNTTFLPQDDEHILSGTLDLTSQVDKTVTSFSLQDLIDLTPELNLSQMRYVRIQLTNAKGRIISDPDGTILSGRPAGFVNRISNPSLGWYNCYVEGATEDQLKEKFTVTYPKMAGLKLVFYFSDIEPAIVEPTGQALRKEPAINRKYTLSFQTLNPYVEHIYLDVPDHVGHVGYVFSHLTFEKIVRDLKEHHTGVIIDNIEDYVDPDPAKQNFFLAWHTVDANGKILPMSADPNNRWLLSLDRNGYSYSPFRYGSYYEYYTPSLFGTGAVVDNPDDLLQPLFFFNHSKFHPLRNLGHQIIAEIAFDRNFDMAIDGDFPVSYVFHFDAEPDDFGNVPDDLKCVNIEHPIHDSERQSVTFSLRDLDLDDDDDIHQARYARVYLTNASGIVENEPEKYLKWPTNYQAPLSGIVAPHSLGKYTTAPTLDDTFTLTAPEGAEVTDFHVYVLLSTNYPTELPAHAPEATERIIVSFDSPFKGRLKDDVEEARVVFQVPEQFLNTTVSARLNLTPAGDKVLADMQYTGPNNNLLTVPGVYQQVIPEELMAFEEIPEQFYIRWYLRDRHDVEEKHLAQYINIGDAVTISSADGRYKFWTNVLDKTPHTPAEIFLMTADLSDANRLIMDYDLVYDVATDLTGMRISDDGTTLLHEPNTIARRFVFSFERRGFVNIPDDVRKEYTTVPLTSGTEIRTNVGAEKTKIENWLQEVSSDRSANLTYARAYVERKDENGQWVKFLVFENEDDPIRASISYPEENKAPEGEGYKVYSYMHDNATTLFTTKIYNESDHNNPANAILNFPYRFNNVPEEDYDKYRIVYAMSSRHDAVMDNGQIHVAPNIELLYICNLKFVPKAFIHYEGIMNHNPDGTPKYEHVEGGNHDINSTAMQVRQMVHEYTYEFYVKPGETKELKLPLQNVDTEGHSTEPQAYFRWYDWKTDFASDCLKPNPTTQLSNPFEDFFEGHLKSRGLFKWLLTENAHRNNVAAVRFTAPEGDDWEEIIACDVSKYQDGVVNGNFMHEPTLSIRYKFVIRPAREIADKIKSAVESGINTIHFYEDNASFFIGINSSASYTSLRPNTLDLTNYYFYPMAITEHGEDGKVTKMEWGDTPVQARRIRWRVYDSTVKYVALLNASDKEREYIGTYANLSLDYLNSVPFYEKTQFDNNIYLTDIDNPEGLETHDLQFDSGSYVYVVGYAEGALGNHRVTCPVVSYTVRFLPDSGPCLFEDDDPAKTIKETFRDLNYLDANFKLVATRNFDDINGEANFAYPTGAIDNISPNPLDWKRASYGYCYPQLYDQLYGNARDNLGLAPLHGDYVILKSQKVEGISNGRWGWGNDGHIQSWFATGEIHDRTYEESDGKQSGYFMYIDASDEARPYAEVDFNADLCVGSCVVFSVAVADLTDSDEQPQVVFRIYGLEHDLDGNEIRHLVHTYTSGAFDSQSVTKNAHRWYQVYGKIFFREDSEVEKYHDFVISIENFCKNTEGADYGVDDIRVYVSNGKSLVEQETLTCGDGEGEGEERQIPPTTIKAKMEQRTLINLLPDSAWEKWLEADEDTRKREGSNLWPRLHYRICRSDGKLVYGDYLNPNPDKVGTAGYEDLPDKEKYMTYASVAIPPYLIFQDYDAEIDEKEFHNIPIEYTFLPVDDDNNGKPRFGFEKDKRDGYVYFVMGYMAVKLDLTSSYYVSMAGFDYDIDATPSSWGNPNDKCSLYSEYFYPRRQKIQLFGNGQALDDIVFTCGSPAMARMQVTGKLLIPDRDGVYHMVEEAIRYNWTINGESPRGEVLEEMVFDHDPVYVDPDVNPQEAVFLKDRDGTPIDGNRKNVYATDENGLVITETGDHIEVKRIGASRFDYTFEYGSHYIVTARPVGLVEDNKPGGNTEATDELTVKIDGNDYVVCRDDIDVTLNTRLGGPALSLGFPEVNYPFNYETALRLGIGQLKDMKTRSLQMNIPTHSYIDKDGNTTHKVVPVGNGEVRLYGTNDPAVDIDEYDSAVGYISGEASIDHPAMQLRLWSKDGDVTKELPMREGYWYKLAFDIRDERDSDDPGEIEDRLIKCEGDTYITLKVVPEYLTWINDVAANTNWNNDDNWRRSHADEIYMSADERADYDRDHLDANGNYEDFVTEKIQGGTRTHTAAFTPMKFTKVTILDPHDIKAAGARRADEDDASMQAPYLGTMVSGAEGLPLYMANNDLSIATENIVYDMMLCIEPSETGYDCEKFYGNTCREIYFKPRAELRNQQLLMYGRAWVEKLFKPGTWYTFATPFARTYGGEMYVPKDDGRQTTRAFQPIIFSEKLHSRNDYPYYQRAWDPTESSREVWPLTDPIEFTEANIQYPPGYWEESDEVKVPKVTWSHGFNDVQYVYEPGRGMALRAHNVEKEEMSLLRLPKDDESYTYYHHDDEAGTDAGGNLHTADVDQTLLGRLSTEADREPGAEGEGLFTVVLENADSEHNTYLLVGNPYMASLSLSEFFALNSHLDKKAWFIDAGTLDFYPKADNANDKRPAIDNSCIIAPMQSFFVKVDPRGTDPKYKARVLFRPSMTVDVIQAERSDKSKGATFAPGIDMMARNAGGKARARVLLDAEADDAFVDSEDVEMILDENLARLPQLYTVGGSTPLLYNKTTGESAIPFGVTTSVPGPVAIDLKGADGWWFVDAVSGISTHLEAESTISVEPNAHGRYFLTADEPGVKEDLTDTSISIYSPEKGKVVVTAYGADRIDDVVVYDVNGATVTTLCGYSSPVEIDSLAAGCYIVKARATAEERTAEATAKILVK